MIRVQARAALVDGRFLTDAALVIDHGTVLAVEDRDPSLPLHADLLLPAFANAHSHAFQWDMRGDTHALSPGREADDFWSWRDAMYNRANTFTAQHVERIATSLYTALRTAGWSAVAEFHYLHHPLPDTADGPLDMALAHTRAARRAGLRLSLIPVAYHRAGPGRPAAGAQQRFAFPDPDTFLRHLDALTDAADPHTLVGAGVHSVRAVPASWLAPIHRWAERHDRPLHIHVSEQRRELDECMREHGCSPIALLAREGFLSPRTTLVHATHIDDADLQLIAHHGAGVCLCPSTERDLGDGLARASDLLNAAIPLSVGTDSHTRIEAPEELALVELHERLRIERRNALAWPARARLRPAESLLEMAAVHGPRALGRPPVTLIPGSPADLVLVRTPRPWTDPSIALDRLLFSSSGGEIIDTLVAGEPSPGRTLAPLNAASATER